MPTEQLLGVFVLLDHPPQSLGESHQTDRPLQVLAVRQSAVTLLGAFAGGMQSVGRFTADIKRVVILLITTLLFQ
jgi:hypothetical protein